MFIYCAFIHKKNKIFFLPSSKNQIAPLRGAITLVEKAGTIEMEAREKNSSQFLIYQMWTLMISTSQDYQCGSPGPLTGKAL